MPNIPNISDFLGNFSLSSFSLGSGGVFTLLILVCILLLVLNLGRTRAMVSLLSIYIAFSIQVIFPYFGWLQDNTSLTKDLAIMRVGMLIIAYVASYLLINRSVLSGKFGLTEASLISVGLMGVMQVGLLASIILNIAPAYQGYLPEIILPYLANQKALFYWALLPLVLLAFQNKD